MARLGIGSRHQRLADQDGVVAGGMQRRGVVASADAALGDLDDAVGNRRSHAHRAIVVDLEGDEVALVDADEVGARRRRATSSSASSWISTSTSSPTLRASACSSTSSALLERGGDQQHAVGAHQPRVAARRVRRR